MKSLPFLALLVAVLVSKLYLAGEEQAKKEELSFNAIEMKDSLNLIIQVGNDQFELRLEENPTSLSLWDQAPFTVEFEDFAGLEKIFYPPQKLSITNAPKGAKPTKGDVMYYAPWGDVAIFYKDASYASGLIPMGKIAQIDAFTQAISKVGKATIQTP